MVPLSASVWIWTFPQKPFGIWNRAKASFKERENSGGLFVKIGVHFGTEGVGNN